MELEKKGKCNVWSEVRGDNIFKMGNAMRVWREYLESENLLYFHHIKNNSDPNIM